MRLPKTFCVLNDGSKPRKQKIRNSLEFVQISVSKSLRQKRFLGLLKAECREPYYEICWWQHHAAGRLVSELRQMSVRKPALHCQRPLIDTPFKQDHDRKHRGDNDTGTTSEQEPWQSPAGTHAKAPIYWKPVKLPGQRHAQMIPVWQSHSKYVEDAACWRYIDSSA